MEIDDRRYDARPVTTDNPSVARLAKGAELCQFPAMRRSSDTPPDTPAPGLLFAIEAVGIALLMAAAAIVTIASALGA